MLETEIMIIFAMLINGRRKYYGYDNGNKMLEDGRYGGIDGY